MAPLTTGQGGSPTNGGSMYGKETCKSRKWTSAQPNVTIPAGAYFVEVYNSGMNTDIQVNGELIKADQKATFRSYDNPVSKKMDLTAQVNVITSAQEVTYTVEYPSDSTVDIQSI